MLRVVQIPEHRVNKDTGSPWDGLRMLRVVQIPGHGVNECAGITPGWTKDAHDAATEKNTPQAQKYSIPGSFPLPTWKSELGLRAQGGVTASPKSKTRSSRCRTWPRRRIAGPRHTAAILGRDSVSPTISLGFM